MRRTQAITLHKAFVLETEQLLTLKDYEENCMLVCIADSKMMQPAGLHTDSVPKPHHISMPQARIPG